MNLKRICDAGRKTFYQVIPTTGVVVTGKQQPTQSSKTIWHEYRSKVNLEPGNHMTIRFCTAHTL